MKIILIALIYLGSNFHDIQVAYYKIHQENDKLHIEFVFEKNDILNALNDLDTDYSDKTLQEYINSNFLLTINDKPQEISFESAENKNKHINLVGSIFGKIQEIRTIDISNTCLLNIDDLSNIIEINLNNKQRDFLMNRERTSIQVNY